MILSALGLSAAAILARFPIGVIALSPAPLGGGGQGVGVGVGSSGASPEQESTRAEAALSSDPSPQALIYYNARVALRDARADETLKLWLLRNTVASQIASPSAHDPDFRSLIWAATGDLGICQDGIREDDDGAGLWPIALHNWVVRSMARPSSAPEEAPFDAFDVGLQQRFISLHDVLSHEELRSVRFFRGDCLRPLTTFVTTSDVDRLRMEDRASVARFLRQLLIVSRDTLAEDTVINRAAIEARIFDLDLAIADFAERDARRQARAVGDKARTVGVSEPAAAELREVEKVRAFPPDSEEAAILRASLTWSVDEWLSLNEERRLFLFAHARPLSTDPRGLDRLLLGIVDALIERRQGKELGQWLAHFGAGDDLGRRQALFAGERGRRLLELDRTTGFRERSGIALHRGVAFLEAGELPEAIRSFAYALQQAESSREAAVVTALCRRWLSYIFGRFETTPDVITTLHATLPRQEFNSIIEDLVWRAALHADAQSFAMATRTSKGTTALDLRIERLRPLASGQVGAFATQTRDRLRVEPALTLRFLRQLIDKLEAEDPDLRRQYASLLVTLQGLLAPLVDEERRATQRRLADALIGRCQAIIDGLRDFNVAPSLQRNARALSPTNETFAGNIRLAPEDPLPWPFAVQPAAAPSPFARIALVPIEWRDPQGGLVYGWQLGE